jgi:hypothetical protein
MERWTEGRERGRKHGKERREGEQGYGEMG